MNKAFTMFFWENDPSVNTPLSAENLNQLNSAVDTIDSRVVTMDTTKANQADLLTAFADVSIDEKTGIITFTKKNGSTKQIDTKLEKLAINFSYDAVAQQLVITLEDGTIQYVDMKALITELEFLNSDTVLFSVSTDGKVTASIAKGSITADMLEPNYLANVQLYASQAMSSANNAKISEQNAELSALRAEEAASKAESAIGGDFATNEKVDNIINGTTTVGNAYKANRVTLYKTFADIDSTISNQSQIFDVIKKMSPNSRLVTTVYEGSVTVYPNNNGVLEILKTNYGEYTVARFTEKKNTNQQSYWLVAQEPNDITGWLGSLKTENGIVTDVPVFGGGVNGADGAKIRLKPPTSNTVITGANVVVDTHGDNFRIYSEVNGSARGFTMDFSKYEGFVELTNSGDKPTGTYTGNGSSAKRTIDVGGNGQACIITGGTGVSIVTEHGAITKANTSTSVSGLSNTAIKFQNGVLTIASTSGYVNTSGTTYTYSVI